MAGIPSPPCPLYSSYPNPAKQHAKPNERTKPPSPPEPVLSQPPLPPMPLPSQPPVPPFPPTPLRNPPPAEGRSSMAFTTGVIAIISTLGAAFVLVIFYTIVAKYCRSREVFRRRTHRYEREAADQPELVWSVVTRGIDESLIKLIPVCKYSKEEGLVDRTDCAVCLSEFEENEALRLLPKCSHAFHLPCIDKWLQTHTNCPLCRANILSAIPIIIPAPRPPLIVIDNGTSGNSSQPGPANGSLEEEGGRDANIKEGNYAEIPEGTAKDGDSIQTAGYGQVSVDHGATEMEAGNELELQWKRRQMLKRQGETSARYSDELQAAYLEKAAPMRSFSEGLVVNDGEEGRQKHGDLDLQGGVRNLKTDNSSNSSNSVSYLRRAYSTGGWFAKNAEVEIASSNEREQRTTRTSCRQGRAARSSSESARDEAAGDDTTTSATRRSLKGVVDVEAGLTESRRRRRSREEMMMGDEEEANLKVGKLLQSLKGSFGLTRSWSCGGGGGGGGRLIFGCMNGDSRNPVPLQSTVTREFIP